MGQAQQLFEDYRYYRQCTAHIQNLKKEKPYLREIKSSKSRLTLLQKMSDWCRDKGVSPRLWLYSLFVTRRWMYAPKLDASHLMSENHLPKYREMKELGAFKRRAAEEEMVAEQVDPDKALYDPNRDISNTVEKLKAYYLRTADSDECMNNLLETLGYHPKSKVCNGCPGREACTRKLLAAVNFDILALRSGEISSTQARKQAVCGAQAYVR